MRSPGFAFVLCLLGAIPSGLLPSVAQAARTSASSFCEDEQGRHDSDAGFDGLLKSGWCEGEDGAGVGSWIQLDLGAMTPLSSISIWPGNLKEGKKSYREYSRPKVITILVDGKQSGDPVRLQDQVQRLDIPLQGEGRKIRVQVDDAFEGFVFSELYIAEVGVNYLESLGQPQARLDSWLASPPGQEAKRAYEQTLKDRYLAHKNAEFGNAQALEWIMDAAGEGAPYLREQVQKLVPAGSRAVYLRPDDNAILALRKLKDPNSIPAIEMASLRTVGQQQQALLELVEIFYAYQKLIGGGNPNIPYWGATGWSEGAIQSFGEPIALSMDRLGNVLVADTGNNRIQRFAENGRPDRVWGAKTDICNLWFGESRPWYVSGGGAGTDPGSFQNPLDVEVIPEKESDSFAVLDAMGRVQVFAGDGSLRVGWTIRSSYKTRPGVGGEAYLAWLSRKDLLFVIWGDEAMGYNLQGEEQVRFEITDGPPNAVVGYKGRQLLLAYREEVIRYDSDGFRFGRIMDIDDLATGFENVDLAVDQDGRLWYLVDTAQALKFKRPGKLDYGVTVADYSLEHPRFVVRDDILFISDRDRILQVDALQLAMDAEEAQASEEAQEL